MNIQRAVKAIIQHKSHAKQRHIIVLSNLANDRMNK